MSERRPPDSLEVALTILLSELEQVLRPQRSSRTRVSIPRFYLDHWRELVTHALRLVREH